MSPSCTRIVTLKYYAAVVPLVEVPSGVLADRWSRRGVLVVASAAVAACALLGGLSSSVVGYMFSAAALGVLFMFPPLLRMPSSSG